VAITKDNGVHVLQNYGTDAHQRHSCAMSSEATTDGLQQDFCAALQSQSLDYALAHYDASCAEID
jgi:hypothetical protein